MRSWIYRSAFTTGLAAFVIAVVTAFPASAQDPFAGMDWGDAGAAAVDETTGDETGQPFGTAPFTLTGYNATTVAVIFDDLPESDPEPSVGANNRLRLKGEWGPQPNLEFRFELTHESTSGAVNDYVRSGQLGFGDTTEAQSQDLGDDFTQTLAFDHAYGTAALGSIDLSFGKQPLAWGVGYSYNPTDVVNTIGFLQRGFEDETPGTTSVVTTWTADSGFSLTGYVAFEDRTHSSLALEDGADPNRIPVGIRMQAFVGSFDTSLSATREAYLVSAEDSRIEVDYKIGMDFVGTLFGLGVYGEATLAAPTNDSESEIDFDAEWEIDDALFSVLGIEYLIGSGIFRDAEIKLESLYYGPGSEDKDSYDYLSVRDGDDLLLGRNYIFLYASDSFGDGYLSATVGTLANLDDLSALLTFEAEYTFDNDFEFTVGTSIPFGGDEGDEFDGRATLPSPEGAIRTDLYSPTVLTELRINF